jgi:mannosyltransferase
VMGWPTFLRTLWGYQGNMALYYLLLRAWVHLGDSEFVVRSLSVLFGVLTIPAVYALGARLFDRATGLAAAVLLSVHSFHIHWSQETRAYSLLTLLLVLTTYFLIRALESNRRSSYWIAFAVAAALSVYAHIFAVLVLGAHALSLALPRPFRVGLRTIAFVTLVFGFLIAPMAAFVLLHHSDQISWIPSPTLADISEFLQLLTSQGGMLLVVVYLVLCGLAFWHTAGPAGTVNSTVNSKESWGLRLLVLWLALPAVLTLAASVIKPLFVSRYMVMCVPAIVILAARGLVNLYHAAAVRHWVATAALVVTVALSGWGAHRYFAAFALEASDWRSAVGYILAHQQPGDGAVFFIPNVYPYRYYVRRAESQTGVAAAPDILYPPQPWQPVTPAEVRHVISGRQRLWLILHIESIDPQAVDIIQSTVAETFHLAEKRVFLGGADPITIALYRRHPPLQ